MGIARHTTSLAERAESSDSVTDLSEVARKVCEERFRILADTAPVMIWRSGIDALVNYCNRCWLEFTGQSFEHELGTGWASGVHADDLDRCLATYLAAFRERKPFTMEYRVRRADGEYRWIIDHGVPLFDSGGVFEGYIGSCLDISDQRQAIEERIARERQQMQAQKMEAIGQLAAGITHDLNNSLTAVVGHLHLIMSRTDPESDVAHSVEVALQGCERAIDTLRQLLSFARHGEYDVTRVQVGNVILQTLQLLSRIIGNDISIDFRQFGRELEVEINVQQMQHAIVNLLINAKQAMPEGGSVVISIERHQIDSPTLYNLKATPGNYVVVSFTDSGVGISAENLGKVFDPFFTTKPQSSESASGTGLGLSMVYSTLQNHGGWVEARSAVNRGSTFSLYLPEAVEVNNVLPRTEQKFESKKEPLALVIDDEPALVELLEKFLQLSGIVTEGFRSGRDAIAWYRDHYQEIDIVVLDMRMPSIDGKQCFEALRQINPDARVVLLSGYTEDTEVKELLENGAIKFFHKPLKYTELVEWITEYLGLSRSERTPSPTI